MSNFRYLKIDESEKINYSKKIILSNYLMFKRHEIQLKNSNIYNIFDRNSSSRIGKAYQIEAELQR